MGGPFLTGRGVEEPRGGGAKNFRDSQVVVPLADATFRAFERDLGRDLRSLPRGEAPESLTDRFAQSQRAADAGIGCAYVGPPFRRSRIRALGGLCDDGLGD
jgi:hypothetical protein